MAVSRSPAPPRRRRRRAFGRLFPGRAATARLAAARARRARERIAEWRQTRILQPVLTLVSGTLVAQALGFGVRPVLTRLYDPAAWGELTLFATTVAVLSTVASGGYRYAVLLPARDDESANVVALSGLGALATAALSAVGVGIGTALGGLSAVWWLLPAAVLMMEAAATGESWLTRHDRFAPVSASRVAQQATVVGVQLGAGLLGGAAGWLVGGAALGFVAAGVAIGVAVVRLALPLRRAWSGAEMRRLARRYVRFPLFAAPAALLNLASTRVPVYGLAFFATGAEVGLFGIAFGALALPLGLVTGSVGQVFFVRAAEAYRAETLVPLTRDVLRGLVAVAAFPSLAVLAAGPTLYATVFGPEWAEAGVYAQRLAPWVLAASVAAPMTALFDVLEQQRADLGFSVVMAAGVTAALVAAGLGGDARAVVLAGSVAGTVLRVAQIGWMLQLARVPLGAAGADVLRALAVAAPFAVGVWAADALSASGLAVLGATLGLGAMAFLVSGRLLRS